MHPHPGLDFPGNQLPTLRVGSPCMKQYISHDSWPTLSSANIQANHASLVRIGSVNSKRTLMESGSFRQKYDNAFCSTNSRSLRNGLLKNPTARTGDSCQPSPLVMRFKPPNGRFEPSLRLAYGCRMLTSDVCVLTYGCWLSSHDC